jgi:acyl-CoA reductase-like NAD-dependent aldehyde dehydrogenase
MPPSLSARVRSGNLPATLCGPVISAKQRERVLGYIHKGLDEGATLLVGGTGAQSGFDRGFWVEPTLFTDVDNAMTIAQEEIFGPVLAVIPYDDEEDAIRIANDSQYGLAGNVMSGSLDHSLAVARRLRPVHRAQIRGLSRRLMEERSFDGGAQLDGGAQHAVVR